MIAAQTAVHERANLTESVRQTCGKREIHTASAPEFLAECVDGKKRLTLQDEPIS